MGSEIRLFCYAIKPSRQKPVTRSGTITLKREKKRFCNWLQLNDG